MRVDIQRGRQTGMTQLFLHDLMAVLRGRFQGGQAQVLPIPEGERAKLLRGSRPSNPMIDGPQQFLSRPAPAMDALQKLEDGRLAMETPPDPRTGATSIALDPLEWIQRITDHIPDPGRHCQRFCGAYSNRARVIPAGVVSADGAAVARPEQDNSEFSREARSTWARLLRKILVVDPLLCACGGD